MGWTAVPFPEINATLNSLAALLLVVGYLLIRRRRVAAHRACMIAAFSISVLFLISYLVYHFQVGSVGFEGTGAIRGLYFTVLISHSVLAAVVPILAVLTLGLGLRGRFERHRAVARWTLPIWLYVSVTGVVIYWMLYQIDF